jgi:hypothetical protein
MLYAGRSEPSKGVSCPLSRLSCRRSVYVGRSHYVACTCSYTHYSIQGASVTVPRNTAALRHRRSAAAAIRTAVVVGIAMFQLQELRNIKRCNWQSKASRLRWIGNLVRKQDGKGKLRRPTCRTESFIKIYLNSVGTATRYGLDGPGIESRWKRDFSHLSRPALHNGYQVFPEGKAAGVWRWPPTPSSTEVNERIELYLYSPSGPSWSVLAWTIPLPLNKIK